MSSEEAEITFLPNRLTYQSRFGFDGLFIQLRLDDCLAKDEISVAYTDLYSLFPWNHASRDSIALDFKLKPSHSICEFTFRGLTSDLDSAENWSGLEDRVCLLYGFFQCGVKEVSISSDLMCDLWQSLPAIDEGSMLAFSGKNYTTVNWNVPFSERLRALAR